MQNIEVLEGSEASNSERSEESGDSAGNEEFHDAKEDFEKVTLEEKKSDL